MFRADILVFQFSGFLLRCFQRLSQVSAEEQIRNSSPLDLVPAIQIAFQVRFQFGRRHADLLQQLGNEAVLLANHGQQQMFAIHFLMGEFLRNALRLF
jgi:hypothetical protein